MKDRKIRVIVELLREKKSDDVLVFGGGVIPDSDVPKLHSLGVSAVFGPGTPTGECVSWLQATVQKKREEEQGESIPS